MSRSQSLVVTRVFLGLIREFSTEVMQYVVKDISRHNVPISNTYCVKCCSHFVGGEFIGTK